MICLRSEKIEKIELSGVSDNEVNILILVVSLSKDCSIQQYRAVLGLSHIHIHNKANFSYNVNNFKKIPGKVIDEILKLKPVKETDEPI